MRGPCRVLWQDQVPQTVRVKHQTEIEIQRTSSDPASGHKEVNKIFEFIIYLLSIKTNLYQQSNGPEKMQLKLTYIKTIWPPGFPDSYLALS